MHACGGIHRELSGSIETGDESRRAFFARFHWFNVRDEMWINPPQVMVKGARQNIDAGSGQSRCYGLRSYAVASQRPVLKRALPERDARARTRNDGYRLTHVHAG